MKLCECGCGEPAPIAKWDHRLKGHVKGEPVRFVNGHNTRGKPKSPETRAKMSAAWAGVPRPWLRGPRPNAWKPGSSAGIHAHLNLHYPKSGVCDECGCEGKTDYAFLRHPAPHTRDRDDYAELCRSCHMSFDFAIGYRGRDKA